MSTAKRGDEPGQECIGRVGGREMSVRAFRTALAGIMLASLGLRLFGIGWGIPDFNPERMAGSQYRNSYHIDEDNFFWGLAQMRPAEGNFDIMDYHWGTLQFYLIDGVMLGAEAAGVLPAPWEAAFRGGDIAAIRKIYALGRLVSVAAGVAGVLLAAMLGNLLAGRLAGLAAGAAYGIAPLAVVEAHYLTNDVVMSVLLLGGVLCAALAVKRGQIRWLAGAGFVMGLAMADKYSAVFGIGALLVAQIGLWKLRIRNYELRIVGREKIWLAVGPWVGLAVGFVLGEPVAVVAPGKIVEGLRVTAAGNASDFGSGLGAVAGMLGWQGWNLGGLGLTWPIVLLSVVGLATLLLGPCLTHHASRIWMALVVVGAIAGLVAGLALNRVPMLRYSQPLVGLLTVGAVVG